MRYVYAVCIVWKQLYQLVRVCFRLQMFKGINYFSNTIPTAKPSEGDVGLWEKFHWVPHQLLQLPSSVGLCNLPASPPNLPNIPWRICEGPENQGTIHSWQQERGKGIFYFYCTTDSITAVAVACKLNELIIVNNSFIPGGVSRVIQMVLENVRNAPIQIHSLLLKDSLWTWKQEVGSNTTWIPYMVNPVKPICGHIST